jgi:hypothetical protein
MHARDRGCHPQVDLRLRKQDAGDAWTKGHAMTDNDDEDIPPLPWPVATEIEFQIQQIIGCLEGATSGVHTATVARAPTSTTNVCLGSGSVADDQRPSKVIVLYLDMDPNRLFRTLWDVQWRVGHVLTMLRACYGLAVQE